MSEEKQYLGIVWSDGRIIRNGAPRSHQTIHLAPAQIIPLLRCLETHLESSSLSIPSTDLTSWLEGYQAGFSASHLSQNERCNHASERSSEDELQPQTGRCDPSQSSDLSAQNHSFSSSPRSVSADAPSDSHSEAGNGSVADAATSEPEEVDNEGTGLSEEVRLEILKTAVHITEQSYEITPVNIQNIYNFLLSLAQSNASRPEERTSHDPNDEGRS